MQVHKVVTTSMRELLELARKSCNEVPKVDDMWNLNYRCQNLDDSEITDDDERIVIETKMVEIKKAKKRKVKK